MSNQTLADKLRLLADHLESHEKAGTLVVANTPDTLTTMELLQRCLQRLEQEPTIANSKVRGTKSTGYLLSRLRVDAMTVVLSFLDVQGVLTFSSTCWTVARLVQRADFLWKQIAQAHLPMWFDANKFTAKPTDVPKTSCAWREMLVGRMKDDAPWRKKPATEPLTRRFVRGIHSLYFDRESLLLGSGQFNEVLSFDLKTGRLNSGAAGAGMFGHTQAVTALRPLPQGQLLTSSLDCTVRLFDRNTMQLQKVYQGHQDKVWCVEYFQGRVFSGSSDKTIRIWDYESTESICDPLRSHRTSISAIRVAEHFSAPLLLTGSAGNTVRVWDIANGEPRCIEKLRGHQKGVFCLQPTQRLILSGSLDNTIKAWDPRRRYRLAYDLRQKDAQGRDIIAGTDETETNIGVICFQADDTKVVSGGPDRILRIWDIRMLAVVNEFEAHGHWITSLQFDEKKIITGSRDKHVRIWDISGRMLEDVSPDFAVAEDLNGGMQPAIQLPPANIPLGQMPPGSP